MRLSKISIFYITVVMTLLISMSSSGNLIDFQDSTVNQDSDIDQQENIGSSTDTYAKTSTTNADPQRLYEKNTGGGTLDYWTDSKSIIFNSAQVLDDHTNFPVLISSYDKDLKTKAQPDGDDIAFFNEAGEQLAHDIELYNPEYNTTHARLISWVSVDLKSSSDTRISMRYGNTTMTNQENAFQVWTGNYDNRWNLGDNPEGAVIDSLLTNNGTSIGSMTSGDVIEGKIGNALEFDGIDDMINVYDIGTDPWQGVTMSAWIMNYNTGDDAIFAVAEKSGGRDHVIGFYSRDIGFRAKLGTDSTEGQDFTTADGTNVANTWQHLVVTWNSTTNSLDIYVDGQLSLSDSISGNTLRDDLTVAPFELNGTIGNVNNLGDDRFFTGIIDELRVSQFSKSAAWIETEYNNQNSPETFYSISEEISLNTRDYLDSYNLDVSNRRQTSGSQTNVYNMNGQDGLINGLTETQTPLNSHSVQSDGTDYITIGNGNPAWNSERGTISFHFRLNSIGESTYRPWGLNNDMEVRISSGTLTVDWGATGVLTSPTSLTSNTWYFVAVVWDETTEQIYLYWSESSATPQLMDSSNSWENTVSDLGNIENNFLASNGGSGIVNGYGDELRYWDIPRSQSEIQQDYDTSLTGRENNLQSYFRFNNNLQDEGPDQNDGNPNGTPVFSTNIPSLTQIVDGFDQQFEFIDIPYQTAYTRLAIYTGAMDIEDLNIDFWTGSSWQSLFTDLVANSWNNQSLTGLLTSSSLIIRIHGGTDIGDTTISSWDIDNLMLTYTNYQLQWEHQVQNLDTSKELYNLTLYSNSSDAEGFDIQFWNVTSQSWTTPIGISITSPGWYNTTIEGTGVINTNTTWRYIDKDPTQDDIQSILDIDYAGISSYALRPTINSPADRQIAEGQTGLSITWIGEDNNPDIYNIYQNNVLIDSNSWQSTQEIIQSLNGLTKGSYNFTIELIDDYSYSVVDTVWVDVTDETLPAVNSPNDQVINETSIGNTLTWTFSDTYPNYYEIYKNKTKLTTQTWTNPSDSYTYNLDNLTKGVYNLTILLVDDSNNIKIDTVFITIIDETTPEIISGPNDYSYPEKQTDNWLNWTITDSYPDTYTIYQNGSVVDNSIWTSQINLNIDGLIPATYNYTLVAFDESGNKLIDTIMITVFDGSPPEIIRPDDVTYPEGTNEAYVSWEIWDRNPGNVSIYRNGIKMTSFGMINGNIDWNVGGLTLGEYNFTIVLYDSLGQRSSDTVIVTVIDTTNPTINHPEDFDYPYLTTGNTIDWIGTDNHAYDYVVLQNGTQVDAGFWISGATISVDIDGLEPGIYDFTIIIYDTSGNSISDSVIVGVSDDSVFKETPNDIDYIKDTTGNYLNWTIIDSDPNMYKVYQNGTEIESGTWTSNVPITINVDGLNYGEYNYTIWANDTQGSIIIDTAFVKVSDSPLWDIQPGDQQYAEGIQNFIVSWNATDMEPASYNLYINGSLFDTDIWTNNTFISVDLGGFLKGNYNITLVIFDQSSNQISHSIVLEVIDETPPAINQPADIEFDEESDGEIITWIPQDAYPNYYEIYQNNTLVVGQTAWMNNTAIEYTTGSLAKGYYNFTIYLYDLSGNEITDSVIVTVLDTKSPVIVNDANKTYSETNVGGNQLEWEVTDNYPLNYTIYRNGSVVQVGSWNSSNNITYTLTSLDYGLYNFTIVVNDTSGNFQQATVWITVIDSTNPTFVEVPIDQTLSEADNNYSISWNATDKYPNYYEIYLNGEVIETGNWTTNSVISYNMTNLLRGDYNLVIIFYDQSGNFVQDQVNISIVDLTPPDFNLQPENTTFIEGSSSKLVNWTITDNYPGYYEIYLNSSLQLTALWENNTEFSYDITDLSQGLYNITIIVFDADGNSNNDTVWIEIIDTTNPGTTQPPDKSYEEFTTSNIISWDANDAHPATYDLYRNESLIESGTWNNTQLTIINIDGLELGRYNFTIVFFDESDNFVRDTIWVEVVDLTTPDINENNSNIEYQEGEINNIINWSISDAHLDYYEIFKDGLPFDTGSLSGMNSTDIVVDIDGLTIGQYNYTIFVYDTSDNFQKNIVFVRVIEINPPQILDEESDMTIAEGNNTAILSWTATDSYPDSYAIYLDGDLVNASSWISGQTIYYNLSSLELPVGQYQLYIEIQDTSDNIYSQQITITIEDQTLPEISSPPDITYESGTTGLNITWNVFDKNGYTYYIFIDEVRIGPFVGDNTNAIVQQIQGLELGNHNFTIQAIDAYGNQNVDTVFVDVIDTIAPQIQNTSGDIIYKEGTLGNSISWTFTDFNPDQFNLTRNGIPVPGHPKMWSSGTLISATVDGLTIGIYEYNLTIWDKANNTVNYIVIVEVIDGTVPTFSSVPDISEISESSTGNTLEWVMNDLYDDRYVIYQNGSQVDAGFWKTNVGVEISIDGLTKGMYNYTIVIFDESDNFNSHTVLLSVIDATAPVVEVTQSVDEYIEGEDNYNLVWQVTDSYPQNYQILFDGVMVNNGTWSDGEEIVWNIDGLDLGTYQFVIQVWDRSDNLTNNTITIDVLDKTAPTLISSPTGFTIDLGTTGTVLTYNATDLHPNTVIVYINGKLDNSQQWNGNEFQITFGNYPVGYHNVTVEIYDTSQNKISHSVIIRVKDPEIIDTRTPQLDPERSVFEGDIEVLSGTWLTVNGDAIADANITVTITDDQKTLVFEFTTTANGQYQIVLNYTGYLPGQYQVDIKFEKQGYQLQDGLTYSITVNPHSYAIQVDLPPTIVQGEVYPISVIVTYANNDLGTSSLQLSEIQSSRNGKTASGVEVIFVFTLLSEGNIVSIVTQSATTTSTGVAYIQLSDTQTAGLIAIQSLEISISASNIGNALNTSVDPNSFPDISPPEPTIIIQGLEFINNYWYYILAGLAGIVIVTGLFVKRRNKELERIKLLNENVKIAYEEIEAIRSIETVIIQTSSSLNLYTEEIKQDATNTYLLSGMINALSSFLDEVGENSLAGFETMQRDDISVTVRKSGTTNFIVISKEQLPFNMLAQIEVAQDIFENKFKQFLKNSARGTRMIKADQVYPIFKEAGLKLGLTHQLTIQEENITKVLEEKFISKFLKEKIRLLRDFNNSDYRTDDGFWLSDLYNYLQGHGLGHRVASRLVMLAYMYDIIDSNIIIDE